MKKSIVFLMHTYIIGQGLKKEFVGFEQYETILITDYKNAELYLGDTSPDVLVIEVPDYSFYPFCFCLEICSRFKEKFPDCRIMLFLTYTHMDDILAEVVEAKREGLIDGFITGQTRIEEIVAGIKSLT